MEKEREMSGFATVDEAFRFVSERPTLLERLYERESKAIQRSSEPAPGEVAQGDGEHA